CWGFFIFKATNTLLLDEALTNYIRFVVSASKTFACQVLHLLCHRMIFFHRPLCIVPTSE
ncbi:MAG: hypothetical protein ACK5D5_06925, partial [Bacteroidota bacterium]